MLPYLCEIIAMLPSCRYALWLAVLLLAGCGTPPPPTFEFKGVLKNKGTPLELKSLGESKAGGGAQVWLVRQDDASKQKLQAVVAPDATFSFEPGNRPVAGKYRICVIWQDDYPLGPDKLQGKFDETNSKVFCTIPADKEITIDVSKPGG